MKGFQTIDELEAFMLKHGEHIVDLMGGEIDRIEMKLRVSLVWFNHFQLKPSHFVSFTEENPANSSLRLGDFVDVARILELKIVVA